MKVPAMNMKNTTPRTPLPDAPVDSAKENIIPEEADAPRDPGEVIQVPSTAPPVTASSLKPDGVPQSDHVEDANANNTAEATSDSDTVDSETTTKDLPAFDWEDLQRRYTIGIQGVNKQEDEILEEFYRFSDVGVQTREMLESCLHLGRPFLFGVNHLQTGTMREQRNGKSF
jgi:hypothetical protein